MELLTDYGKIDILWLDGGWVAKTSKSAITSWYDEQLEKVPNGYLKHRIVNQDILMDDLVIKARNKQPDLIVVDRAVHGKNQNYLTPENRVPDKKLPYPWESCIISAGGWSHTKNAKYMNGRQAVQLLVDIVAKGGNLLLNIAPTPQGEWQNGAYQLLKTYSHWMKINGEGIYNTKVLAPYKKGNICMAQKDSGEAYFFYLCEKGQTKMPERINIPAYKPAKGDKVTILGYHKSLKWEQTQDGFVVNIPKALQISPPCSHVWTIKVSK